MCHNINEQNKKELKCNKQSVIKNRSKSDAENRLHENICKINEITFYYVANPQIKQQYSTNRI